MGAPKTRELVLRYQGLFDIDAVYHDIIDFFKRRNYDYSEKNWKEKDATPEGREITIKMVPEKKVNEYIKYEYGIEWKMIDVHDVEVVRDGNTHTLQHCRFHLKVTSKLVTDWQGLGKSEGLKSFFEKRVIDKEIRRVHLTELQHEMQALLDLVKDRLHMEMTRTDKEALASA